MFMLHVVLKQCIAIAIIPMAIIAKTAVNIQGFSLKQSEQPSKQFFRQTLTINSRCQWEELGPQLERVFGNLSLGTKYVLGGE